ncbi:MAG: cbb3-type cytochrome c oxidase subunit I [Spirochaetia bacterium]|nr:cbb3-type cytochrome c oxidase subunit I [Spirochaetia bacterium]
MLEDIKKISVSENDKYYARKWFTLSVASLVVAGLFSLFLTFSRIPFFSQFISDPLFFKRALVVHVDLALIVWMFSFIAAAFYVLIPGDREKNFFNNLYFGVSVSGVGLMVISPIVSGSAPILANYVPVVDNSLFIAGLLMFAGGLLFTFLDSRLLWDSKKNSADAGEKAYIPGIRVAVLLFIIALEVFLVSYLNTDSSSDAKIYYEILFWGGGHLLQMASEMVKVSIWIFLLYVLTHKYAIKRHHFFIISGLYLLPVFIFVPYALTINPANNDYRNLFTNLMRWGIFPFVTAVFVFCVHFLYRLKKEKISYKLNSLPYNAFIISVILTITGYILGAFIGGSNTMIPAHYHASIGAVTVAFMAFAFIMLKFLDFPLPQFSKKKIVSYQPMIFGIGQITFSIGFAIAGSYGMGRKVYGAEQQVRGFWDYLGLSIMGLGGFVAIIGGLIFLSVVLAAMWKKYTELNAAVKILNKEESYGK